MSIIAEDIKMADLNALGPKLKLEEQAAEKSYARSIIASMVFSARAEANVLKKSENPDAEKINELNARISLYEKENSEVLDGCLKTQRPVIAEYEPVYESYRDQVRALMLTRPCTPSSRTARESEVLQSMFGKSRIEELTRDEKYQYRFGRSASEKPSLEDNDKAVERLAKAFCVKSEEGKARLAAALKPAIVTCPEKLLANPVDSLHTIFCITGQYRKNRRELGLD